jgi:hypothetical protein
MFERYPAASRRVVFFARCEAVHRGVSAISPEDLLLGLTWEEGTRADRIANLKEKALLVRAALGIPHRPMTSIPYGEERNLPLTNESKRVLAYASFEANDDKEFQIDTDHLLRALLRERTSASDAVEKLGVSLSTLRAASRQDRLHHPAEKPPWYWKPPFLVKRSEWATAGLLLILILLIAGGRLWSFMHS